MVINMFTHFAQKYFGSQIITANLFNGSHFFLNYFLLSFFNLSDFKNIFFFYSVKLVILIRQTMLHISGSRVTSSVEARRIYLRNITTCTTCSYILPMASAKGHCHTQLNLTRWMLDGYFLFPRKGLWSTFFIIR